MSLAVTQYAMSSGADIYSYCSHHSLCHSCYCYSNYCHSTGAAQRLLSITKTPQGLLLTFLYRGFHVGIWGLKLYTRIIFGSVNYSLRKIQYLGSEDYSLRKIQRFSLRIEYKIAKETKF